MANHNNSETRESTLLTKWHDLGLISRAQDEHHKELAEIAETKQSPIAHKFTPALEFTK